MVGERALLGKKAFAWFLAVRVPFLTASITPVLLGGAIAWSTRHEFSWGLLFLTILAGALMHLGVNVINDYFDHASSNDDINVEFIRPFSGGSRVIQMGLLTPLEMLVGAAVLFGLSSAIGLYLAAVDGARGAGVRRHRPDVRRLLRREAVQLGQPRHRRTAGRTRTSAS